MSLESPQQTSIPSVELITKHVRGWLEEANLPVGVIDPDGSLFELGIDSLGAAQIIDSVEHATGKRLNPNYVFSLETIAEFAEYLDSLSVAPREETSPCGDGSPDKPLATQPDVVSTDDLGSDIAAPRGSQLAFFDQMNRTVDALKGAGQYFFHPVIERQQGASVVIDGQPMLMLGSYGYLGLLDRQEVKRAAIEATDEFGTGHHGARLLAGTMTIHERLERQVAEFMDSPTAIVFSSGYVANLSTISAVVGPGDVVIGDQWNHASIADGCRMSGAEFVEFPHNDVDSLRERLRNATAPRKLVVVDAVYSMEGDIADLPPIVELCRQYDALLMVDEAHSLGVLGRTGRGVQEHFDLSPHDIDIKMGTLSKTLASSGGFVAAREEIVTYLRHHARGYIFSGAMPAAQTAAASAALGVLQREPQLVEQLRRNVAHYVSGVRSLGFDTGACQSPIVPIMTGANEPTLQMTEACRRRGLLVFPVCYPAVPMDAPRLRTCVSAVHTADQIQFALDVLGEAGRECGVL